jgi:hypothetical protein
MAASANFVKLPAMHEGCGVLDCDTFVHCCR